MRTAVIVAAMVCGCWVPDPGDRGINEVCDERRPCPAGLVCLGEPVSTCQFPEVDAGAPPCTPGSTQCEGARLLTCAADGMRWTVSAPCHSACENGACLSPDAGPPDAGP